MGLILMGSRQKVKFRLLLCVLAQTLNNWSSNCEVWNKVPVETNHQNSIQGPNDLPNQHSNSIGEIQKKIRMVKVEKLIIKYYVPHKVDGKI